MRRRAIGGQQDDPAKAPIDRRCTCTAARTLQLPGIAPGLREGELRSTPPLPTAPTAPGSATMPILTTASARRLVRIREIGPGDGDVVDEVFAGLSPYSRYLRFQAPVAELSAATRRSLTALDGRTHVALAAFSQGRPIGIVRIIDLGDGRGELAVEVIDALPGLWSRHRTVAGGPEPGCGAGLPRARRRDARGECRRPHGPAPRLRRGACSSRWFGADGDHARRR